MPKCTKDTIFPSNPIITKIVSVLQFFTGIAKKMPIHKGMLILSTHKQIEKKKAKIQQSAPKRIALNKKEVN